MEKYIKNLSITLMILTGLFFLSALGGQNGEVLHMPQSLINILIAGANALFFIIPILYLVQFGIGMVSVFKRAFNAQVITISQKFDKFPTVWFLLSCLSFILFISMVII